MKTLFYKLVFAGMITIGTASYAQVSQSKFLPSNATPVALNAQNGIVVSYQLGAIGNMPAICIGFKNTSTRALAFTWTLKNANGKAVYTGNKIRLEAGQSLDLDRNPMLKNRLTFIINTGMKAEDYKTEITIKN